MKRLKGYLIFILIINFIFIINIKAMVVSTNNVNLYKGESTEIELSTVTDRNIIKIDFDLNYSVYEMQPIFNINQGFIETYQDGIHHTVDLNGVQTGNIYLGNINISTSTSLDKLNGIVSINNAKATLDTGEIIDLNEQKINITIVDDSQTNNINIDTTKFEQDYSYKGIIKKLSIVLIIVFVITLILISIKRKKYK